ncbi:type IV toxin-antitoxin system AbiEi family antitoxin domain-containing protein [Nocardia sp. JW2]|uniref:type IV toxin-antitoxin system AbiEi family antitoxin domain-containing protein n=1 Tax=Nocardia sp. JW2 TaxID=3450738 RepID=UPI003F43F621
MHSDSRAAALVALANDQWGLVTSRQAGTVVGVSPQHLKQIADAGVLERVRHGMYRVANFPYDQHQDLRVAWMALDPARVVWERLDDQVPVGVISHRSAAVLHGLGDMDADVVELTSERRIRLSMPEVEIHRGRLERADWEVIDGLAVTTGLRTVADLAKAGIDTGHLGGVVRDALSRGRVGEDDLIAALADQALAYGHAPFDGRGFLDALVEMAGVPTTAISLAHIAAQHTVARATDPAELAEALKSLLPPGQLLSALERIRTETTIEEALAKVLGAIMQDPTLVAALQNAGLREAFEQARPVLDPATLRAIRAAQRTGGRTEQ